MGIIEEGGVCFSEQCLHVDRGWGNIFACAHLECMHLIPTNFTRFIHDKGLLRRAVQKHQVRLNIPEVEVTVKRRRVARHEKMNCHGPTALPSTRATRGRQCCDPTSHRIHRRQSSALVPYREIYRRRNVEHEQQTRHDNSPRLSPPSCLTTARRISSYFP